MKVYFYCSYNLSPVGYQKISLDPVAEEQGPCNIATKAVETLLTHGGAESALGMDGLDCYFVIKGVKHTDVKLSRETPGRSLYLNLGVTSPAGESEEVLAVAYYVYTQYHDFVVRFASCITPQDGEVSYTVDPTLWRQLMEVARIKYAAFLKNGEAEFSNAPHSLSPDQLMEAFDLIRRENLHALYEFALLEGDAEYFRTSCGCDDPAQPVHFVLLNGSPESARPTGSNPRQQTKDQGDRIQLDPKLLAAGIVVGLMGAGVTAYGTYRLGKLIGGLRRKR